MCNVASGGDFSSTCPVESPGIDSQYIWLFNRDEVTFTGESSGNHLFTGFTVASGGKQAYNYEMHNTGNSITETFQLGENGGGSFFPSLNLRALGTSENTSKAISDLVGADVVAVVRTKSGKFVVLGTGGGLTLTANDFSTNGDALGETFTLSPDPNGDGEPFKHKYLLDTDEATTLAAMIAAETPTA